MDTRETPWRGPWPALYAGLVAGLLGQILVFRLNPELEPGVRTLVVGGFLWMTWGLALLGVPMALIRLAAARVRGRRRARPAVWPMVAVFFLAGLLSWVNADLHPDFLSTGGRRQLYQDAVSWAAVIVLILVGRALVRRWRSHGLAALLLLMVPLLPMLRIVGAPTILGRPLQVRVEPLGRPQRPLVVIGVESLDATVLLGFAAGRSNPTLETLMAEGAWGSLDPFRPNLEGAHWTTLATGTLPQRHGVKRQVGWSYPAIIDGTFRILPWTPQGSRLFLPWDGGKAVEPPPSTIPPLWQRLAESGVQTVALNWPGQWQVGLVEKDPGRSPQPQPEEELLLDSALVEVPDESGEILKAARRDQAFVSRAVAELQSGTTDVWVRLRVLKTSRRLLEPRGMADSRRRRAMAGIVQVVDRQLGRIIAAAPEGSTIAVVSTTGMAAPDGWEAVLRFLGLGQDWRASAAECPDGALILAGPGVAPGASFAGARLEDVTPTLCYLLDLPVSQHMEGRVILDAIDPVFLSGHPLRVVE